MDFYITRDKIDKLFISTGCGIEMPDWIDHDSLQYFLQWNGEIKYIQVHTQDKHINIINMYENGKKIDSVTKHSKSREIKILKYVW